MHLRHLGQGLLGALSTSLLLACGAGAASSGATESAASAGSGDVTAIELAPPEGRYAFTTEVLRLHRTERNETTLRGVWSASRAAGGWQSELRVTEGRYARGEHELARLPAEGSGPADVVFAQHLDARALPTELVDALALDGLGGLAHEVGEALSIAPIGSPAIALPLVRAEDGTLGSMVVLPLPPELGLPRELPVRCTTGDVASEPSWIEVRCETPLDLPLPATEEARAMGLVMTLEGSIAIAASIERATGIARQSEVHYVIDLVQTMGDHVEHEGGDTTVRTRLEPAAR